MAKKKSHEEVISEMVGKFGDRYDYSESVYEKSSVKMKIRCVEHDTVFEQLFGHHMNGNDGCPVCKSTKRSNSDLKERSDNFFSESKRLFGDRFGYDQSVYTGNGIDVRFKCIEHNEYFDQNPQSHLKGYNGCSVCKSNQKKENYGSTLDEFIEKSEKVHGDRYDYSVTEYKKCNEIIRIRCKKHNHIFEQLPTTHVQGFNGCPICYKEETSYRKSYSTNDFIEKAKETHGDKYDYSKTVFDGSHNNVTITCKLHGDFEQVAYYHSTGGSGCPICGANKIQVVSGMEKEISDFVSTLDPNIRNSDRSIIYPLEIDILSDKHKMGIEFNGLFWHSSGSKDTDSEKRKYHLNKTNLLENMGYTLFHIFENEWIEKKEIVKSMINSRMGLSKTIYARKCEIVEIDGKISKKFFDDNHMQGSCVSKNTLGLSIDGIIVCAMSFGKSRYSDADYELLRFCNVLGYNVIGGASRLFKHHTKNNPGRYVSYANRRWSRGNMYEKLGFEYSHDSEPCYWYVKNKEIWHRSHFMKHMLPNKIKQFDERLSEVDNMYINKYRRIWDCGNKVYFYES